MKARRVIAHVVRYIPLLPMIPATILALGLEKSLGLLNWWMTGNRLLVWLLEIYIRISVWGGLEC